MALYQKDICLKTSVTLIKADDADDELRVVHRLNYDKTIVKS